MVWQIKDASFDLRRRALLMGIVNVTLDSFYDGGKFASTEAAVAHGLEMAAQGADILDIGGESTRPGAAPVAMEEELRRVRPVIEALAPRVQCAISIDTSKPEVARAAIAAGAGLVNDVTGLRDPEMLRVLAETGAGAIAMHMQGAPADMQRAPHYEDVTAEVREFFRHTFARVVNSGLDPMKIAFDPGIGFGKTVAHNLALLKDLAGLRVEDRPLVLGVSRKSFLGKITGSADMEARLWPTVALTSYARERGANVIRVHDVRQNSDALRMTEAILG